MPHYDEDSPIPLPQSDSMHWFKCDHCEHLHLILFDEDNHPFATAVISEEQLQNMLETVREENHERQQRTKSTETKPS